jgi:y4mF family transcriptional regulator
MDNHVREQTLGRAVAQKRLMLGLTQREFALRAGVGLRFLRDLEQGKPTIRLDKLMDVLTFLGCQLEIVPRTRSDT